MKNISRRDESLANDFGKPQTKISRLRSNWVRRICNKKTTAGPPLTVLRFPRTELPYSICQNRMAVFCEWFLNQRQICMAKQIPTNFSNLSSYCLYVNTYFKAVATSNLQLYFIANNLGMYTLKLLLYLYEYTSWKFSRNTILIPKYK